MNEGSRQPNEREKQDGLPLEVWLPLMSVAILAGLFLLGLDTFAA